MVGRLNASRSDRPASAPSDELDAPAVLARAQDPARYTDFLDDDPAPEPVTPSTTPVPEADRVRGLGDVAARLAAALTDEAEPDEPYGPDEPDEPHGPDAPSEHDEPDGEVEDRPDGEVAPGAGSGGDGGPADVPEGVPVEPAAAPAVPHHRLKHPVLRPPATAMRSRTGEPDPDRAAHYRAHSVDLALSGGVQSALAGGAAVCALGEHYALRRIGGSSAAAVTAAAAAAAELGRTVPLPDEAAGGPETVAPGFAGIAGMLAWLAGIDLRQVGEGPGPRDVPGWRLARMLHPDATTGPLYRLVMSFLRLGRQGSPRRGVRLAAAAWGEVDRAARVVVVLLWLAAVAGCAGVVVSIARSPHVADALVPVAAVPIAVTFALAASFGTVLLVAHTVWTGVRIALDDDGFGLVPGVGAGAVIGVGGGDQPEAACPSRADRAAGLLPTAGTPALFDWVTDRLDDLAGVPTPGRSGVRYALTFGELWLGRMGGRAAGDLRLLRRAATDPRRRAVDLVLVATDLTAGRPRLLPFGAAERPDQLTGPAFWFCRSCLVDVLPARVADQMVLMAPDAAPTLGRGANCPRHEGEPLQRLPQPWDLPVAFAVRLAAALPGLMRPVPLFALADDGTPHLHWFGDGAVTGGLPTRAFDTPLPWWPTVSVGATFDPAADDVTVPPLDASPTDERRRPVAGPLGLLTAALAASSTWRDALRAQSPGRRGGLAAVRGVDGRGPLPDDEEVGLLAVRGYRAGQLLRERFTAPDDGEEFSGIDRFRWVRLRQALTEYRQLSLSIGTSIPLYTDLALAYRVPEGLGNWFSPPLSAGHADPAWGDAVAAVTHLRSLAEGGVLDWDTDWGAPPTDPHERLG